MIALEHWMDNLKGALSAAFRPRPLHDRDPAYQAALDALVAREYGENLTEDELIARRGDMHVHVHNNCQGKKFYLLPTARAMLEQKPQ